MKSARPLLVLGLASIALAGCEDGQMPAFLQPAPQSTTDQTNTVRSSGRVVERDVEAPEVFQVTEAGLWDGRPSLGGVWVAHPDVADPERVIIRNPTNGKFVVGALFRKERETPGPRLQVSSDAADTLKMIAGQPTNLNVTALRRAATPAPEPTATPIPTSDGLEAPDTVTAKPLDDVATTAAAALDATTPNANPVAQPASRPAATPAPSASSLSKPFIQIGIFSVEKNATNTAAAMRNAGLVPTVKKGSSSGKSFWRVIVGPATSAAERAELLKTIKSQGFSDAYAVTN